MSKRTAPASDQSLTIRFPGKLDTSDAGVKTGTLTIEKTYTISSDTRGDITPSEPVTVTDNNIIEFQFDDNTVWLGDFTTIDDVFPGTSEQVRSVEQGEKAVVDIPVELTAGEQNRSGIVQRVALKIVKIFVKDKVEALVKDEVGKIVKELAGKLEQKQLNQGLDLPKNVDHKPGLYTLQCTVAGEFDLSLPDSPLPDGHYLLFLHGTASSTLGSFGALSKSQAWQFITQTFGDKVLAFEHETLTKSPLDNVLDLVGQLPPKATLTLISHSRGGLVGDTLNRFFAGNSATSSGFSAKEKDFLRKQDRTDAIDQIENIEAAIRGKNISIDKFIRVACTASGTSLASHRLDIYFNVLFNLIGLATAQAANPVYIAFKDLLAELIKTKDDASVLPGLEAQSPRSPFNQMLNNADPETVINTPLVIIAGDAEMSTQWKAIKVALSNLFFLGDNDFVVDTRSMYNGAKRVANKVQYFFDQSADVSHFSYFKNPRTQDMLRLALQTPADTLISGFSKLDNRAFATQEIRNIDLSIPGGTVFVDTVSGQKPIVVLLPGIMGSTLTVKDRQVWINFFGFVTGSLSQLEHSSENNLNIRANGLVGSSYRKLVEYLKRDYDVVTFPFDWRASMADNAAALNQKLLNLLKVRQPIKLIGHSMGGVLIRDFILNHDSTWQTLNTSRDFRLLFLGAPLGGSFRIPYVLFGLDSLISTLDHIDVTHTRKDLLSVFTQFPGILSLLPLDNTDPINDFARVQVWDEMRKAFHEPDWPIPTASLLEEFGKYRAGVHEGVPKIDFSHAAYIAGQSRRDQQTISKYQIVQKGNKKELQFLATKEGDESVTWESGIPDALKIQKSVYFSDVPHGELANEPKLFAAISDLLNTGATTLLRQTKPTLRSLDTEFKAKTTFDFNLSPEGVEKTLLGLASDSRFVPSDVPISVSVSNGDLKYALYPVMAGHFENDGILFAEKAIDWYLSGELSRRHRLGLYPGPFGTSETLISNTGKQIRGAVILGLGRQGELTEFRLTSSVEQGVAKYLATLNHKPDGQPNSTPLPKRIGISTLLIGSGYGGQPIASAVRAVIQGVQNANIKIRQIYDSPRIVETIEFIELYKDRALACIKAVSAIEQEENRALNIIRTGRGIKKLDGGRERLPIDDTTEWWTRITVRQTPGSGTIPDDQRSLQFSVSTDAARLEEKSLRTLNATLTGMLEDLSRNDNWSPELARAIFELMIPNDFKPQVKRQTNINWILDKYTAAFPWELLQDSAADAQPLCVNAGMVRQLATGDFRINITPVAERTAIVIGDPNLEGKFNQLPAASVEGTKIAQFLLVQGYEVNKLINASAAQILRTLFCKNYKIVHLAGHGVFHGEPKSASDPKKPTGMLIGPEAYLTPAYIEQMSNVPELVFVNCCFLGQADGAAEELSRGRFQLAANIGTQLIEIGVKAVIVAGWAVNDSAALDFAERFYQSLFEGNSFGEAVQKARKSIYTQYGSRNNTWGAYQCYGDPFYKLSMSADSQKPHVTFDFVVAEEAEIELSNLLGKIESGIYNRDEALKTIEAIDQAISRSAVQSVRSTELQALLYSWLSEYELAVATFEKLWLEEKATFSFSTIEKFCDTQIKWQAIQVKKAKSDPESAAAAITKTIADLKNLMRFGETAGRFNLIANAYKSLALISNDSDTKRKAYERAASYYQKAFKVESKETKYYPLTNWLVIEQALVLTGIHAWGKDKPDWLDALKNELTTIHERDEDEKAYWDWIAEATLLLCKYLLGDTEVAYETILQQFTTAWKKMGSQWLQQAEIEHLEFLEDALGMSPDKAKNSLALVGRLKTALTVMA